MCLVAIELKSGFILLEEFSDRRDGQSWNDSLESALRGLENLNIAAVASDAASGLLKLTHSFLGVTHIPDLFHIEHDYCKSLSLKLARDTQAAKDEVEKIRDQEKCESELNTALTKLQLCSERQERFKSLLQGFSSAMHPVCLTTGERQGDSFVLSRLKRIHADILQLAAEVGVSERGKSLIEKAGRQLKSCSQAIAFFS
jgi:hypothetical protein